MNTTNKSIAIIYTLLFAITFSFSALAKAPDATTVKMKMNSFSNTELGMEYTVSDNSPVGISVTKVYSESIAQLMGIEDNDQILGIGTTPIMGNFENLIKEQKPGTILELRIQRRKEQIVVKTTMPALYNTTNAKAFLGVETSAKSTQGKMGVEVQNVISTSAAEFAGIRKGDVIIGVANKPVISGNLADLLSNQKAGAVVLIRIKRGNEIVNKNVILGSHGEQNPNSNSEDKGGIYTRL